MAMCWTRQVHDEPELAGLAGLWDQVQWAGVDKLNGLRFEGVEESSCHHLGCQVLVYGKGLVNTEGWLRLEAHSMYVPLVIEINAEAKYKAPENNSCEVLVRVTQEKGV